MAFFGLTLLGYQNPIGDKMIANPRRESHGDDGVHNIQSDRPPSGEERLGSSELSKVHIQQLPCSTDVHHGSHKQYKEMVKRVQTPRSPNQLYVTPLTDSQQYGWMTSDSPEPWTQGQRFPRKNSEMTKFVKEMSMTDRQFSLF
ncbi:unnamed protein product [Ophioblennius macclurei]